MNDIFHTLLKIQNFNFLFSLLFTTRGVLWDRIPKNVKKTKKRGKSKYKSNK